MKIVLFGCTGQIGSVVYKTLCGFFQHDEITGCARNVATTKGNHSLLKFNPFNDDWSVLGKVDVLINCIGIIEETSEMTYEKAHAGLTNLLLKHRLKLGNPRIIQLSILGADSQSPSLFNSTKAMADALLLKEHDTFVVRPSIVCTPNTLIVKKFRLIKKISAWTAGITLFPSGFLNAVVQPVMGEDVAGVIAKLCTQGQWPHLIPVVGAERMKLGELLKKNMNIRFIPLPQRLFIVFYTIFKPFLKHIINEDQVIMLAKDNVADAKIAESILNRGMISCDNFWKTELN